MAYKIRILPTDGRDKNMVYIQQSYPTVIIRLKICPGGPHMSLIMSVQEQIMFRALSGNRPVKVELGEVEGEVKIVNSEKIPSELIPQTVVNYRFMQEVLHILAKEGCCYLTFKGGNFIIYKKEVITLVMNEIIFKGLNNKKTPILEIDGVRCSGYLAIALQIFGEPKSKKYMKKFLEPYLIINIDMSNPVIEKFTLIKREVGWRGNKYPLIGYEHLEFKGISSVMKACPDMTEETQEAILQHIGWIKGKSRAEEMVELFKIEKMGLIYNFTDPDTQEEINVVSKAQVTNYIKAHPKGGSISKETSRKLFATLENKYLQ